MTPCEKKQDLAPFSGANMIEVVDSHHKVLLAWSAYRKTLNAAPQLITFDHHTDTSRPFRNYIHQEMRSQNKELSEDQFLALQQDLLAKVNFNEPATIISAIKNLSNDEHIVTAIESQIISSAFVIAHNCENTDLNIYKQHKIICREIGFKQTQFGLNQDHDSVLNSTLIDSSLSGFNKILRLNNDPKILDNNYILDVDLDYFNTFKSIEPQDSASFLNLVKNAGLITIATEPDYVESCSIDKMLNSEYLLKKLLSLINTSYLTQ
mgnify:CR=1 FL=1|jgi:hypothetical protein